MKRSGCRTPPVVSGILRYGAEVEKTKGIIVYAGLGNIERSCRLVDSETGLVKFGGDNSGSAVPKK